MSFFSTNGRSPAVDLRTALIEGLAPDGGLYLPERIVSIPPRTLETLRGLSFPALADQLAQHILAGQVEPADLSAVVRSALNFPVPLVELSPGVHALELFHGPTLAFKDVGARFMSALLGSVLGADRGGLTILVATSGDTGSAVAQAFLGIPDVQTVVLFPKGKVSTLQEKQFTTLGGNVRAIEVDGTFDDCQRLVKEAFADEDLHRRLRLSSANSINIGRLIPQIFYYFHAWAQLPEGEAPLFSVPSGNFGNLTAGLMAKRLGLPTRGFVAATNINDTVPDYLKTGTIQTRPSVQTISNAMDVGNPSNLARILSLYDDDLDRLRSDVVGSVHDDTETARAIRRVYETHGYVLDPHSAVGYLGISRGRAAFGDGPSVFLATAHPIKFRNVVEAETNVPLETPPRLQRFLDGHRKVEKMGVSLKELRALLLGT